MKSYKIPKRERRLRRRQKSHLGGRGWDGGAETDLAEHQQSCRCLQRETPGGSKQICACKQSEMPGDIGAGMRHGSENKRTG